jgi:outer membrane receptor protein involved in Fe transport
VELSARQSIGPTISVTGSTFVSHFTSLIKSFDADQAGPGMFLGWPVDYIDFPVNEGEQNVYGGNASAEWLFQPRADIRVVSTAALSLVDGKAREEDEFDQIRVPISGMAPVRFVATADLDWSRWSAAPRLIVSGDQRTGTLIDSTGGVVVHHISGYAVLDFTIKRHDVIRGGDLFVSVENLTDRRYRHANLRAYENPEELVGVPQNPRRIAVGLSYRFK